MNISQLLEQRAERGTMIGSTELMNRIEADLQPRRFSLAHPGLGFVAAAVVTLVLVGGILLALRPDHQPLPPAETSTTTTTLASTTTVAETQTIDLAAWVGTYTWTEYAEGIDPAVQDTTSDDVLVHELHLTQVDGETLTGSLTQNGSQIDRYVDAIAVPSGEALDVYPTEDTGPYTTERPLFALTGDPTSPGTILGQLATLRDDWPPDGTYFEPPGPDPAEEALANRQFVWEFQPGVDDPEALRTALDTFDSYSYTLIRLVDEGDQTVRDLAFDYLKQPSPWNVQTLALMQRYGRPSGTREHPEPWPGDIKWEIFSALQEASQATFGSDAELAVDMQIELVNQELAFCEEEPSIGCDYAFAWYAVPETVTAVESLSEGPLVTGVMRTASDTGAGGEFEFAALPTDKGWRQLDGRRTKRPFVAFAGPDAIVATSAFDVSGYADPSAELVIEGVTVPVDPVTGSWATTIDTTALASGWNEVVVTATLDGETNTAVQRVRYEPNAVGQFAFIKGLDTSGTQPALIVDYAEFLGGDEAVQAAIEDGELPPDQADEGLPNDFYIRNNNPQLRTLPLDDDALVYLFDYTITDEFDFDPVSIDTLIAAMQSDDQSAYYFSLDDYPVWLTIKDGTILQITPQYLP